MDAVNVALTNERIGFSSFNYDYTPTPEAIALVNRVFDYIEKNPKKWDQSSYGNHLTETNCFMGIVCRISDVITCLYSWHENNGDVAEDFHEYGIYTPMGLLGMTDYEHDDRFQYIAHFLDVRCVYDTDDKTPLENRRPWRHPTLDELRERVSIAMSHDFRKPNNTTPVSLKKDS